MENILISEPAIVAIGTTYLTNQTEQVIAASFAYQAWFTGVIKQLAPLFVMYAVARKNAPHVQTISFGVARLCNNAPSGALLCAHKVWLRVRVIAKELRVILGPEKLRKELLMVKQILRSSHVPGVFKKKPSRDELLVLLATYYDPAREPYLARKLRQ